MREYEIVDKSSLLEAIYSIFDLDYHESKLIEICNKVGTVELYSRLKKQLDDSIFYLISNALAEEYQFYKKNHILHGDNYVDRTEDFLSKLSEYSGISSFLEKYPILKDKINIKINNFFSYSIEIITNLEKDKQAISEVTEIEDFTISSISDTEGDTHNGASVRIVELLNGEKVVYKPRSLATDNMLHSVINFLKEVDSSLKFYIPWSISFDDHSWQEFIEDSPLNSWESVSEFYYLSGIYLSVFLLFGTCDLHYENIHVKNQSPVFIDLEVLGLGDASEGFPIFKFDLPQTSVLNSYLLPIPSNKDIMLFNASGLFPDTKNSKTTIINELEISEVNEWKFVQREIRATHLIEKLSYNGKKVLPEQVEKEIKAGFTTGLDIILKNKDIIRSILNDGFKQVIKIRQVLRPTVVYSKFLEVSNSYKYLTSSDARDNLFNVLLENFKPGNLGYFRVQDEIRQLKNDDVPCFYMYSNSKNLYNNNDIIIEDYYSKDYQSALFERLDLLDYPDLEKQIRYIELSLAAYYPLTDFFHPINESGKRERKIEEITNEFIDYISDVSVEYAPDRLELYTLQVNSLNGEEKMFIEGIESGLYNSGGIVLTLINLDNSKSQETAKKLYDTIKEKALSYLRNPQNEINIGVFTGLGGLVYLTYQFYNKTRSQEYLNTLMELQSLIKKKYEQIKVDKFNDFINGEVGLLTLLSNIYQKESDLVDSELMDTLYEIVKESFLETNDLSYSHGIIGEGISLLSLYKIHPSVHILNRIEEILKSVKANIDLLKESNSWCRGMMGYYLFLYRIAEENFAFSENCKLELGRLTIDDVKNLLSLNSISLCHGNVGNILILNRICNLFNKNVRDYCMDVVSNSISDPFLIKWTRGSSHYLESFMLGMSGSIYAMELIRKGGGPLIHLMEV